MFQQIPNDQRQQQNIIFYDGRAMLTVRETDLNELNGKQIMGFIPLKE